MNYIIFDLEWNNAYSYAKKGFTNEIIEIGAVKLNKNMQIVDTFKQLIKPQLTKKLSTRCKDLTHITNEELRENGIPFKQAISDFARWSKGENNVFLTWSNSDLYVLTSNYQMFVGNADIDFITNYCDAQKYCMLFLERENNNQISLSKCSELMNISVDVTKLHRALTDCYLTAECVKKVFDKNAIKRYINPCDRNFFERLIYKPYLITTPKSDLFDVYSQKLTCPDCSGELVRLKDFECVNKSFRTPAKCENCKKTFWTTIRAKKEYDGVNVSFHYVEMNRKRAKKIKQSNSKPKNKKQYAQV